MNSFSDRILGDIANIQNGYAFKSQDMGATVTDAPVIKIKDVMAGLKQLENVSFYQRPLEPRLSQFSVKKGDVLIAMTGNHYTDGSAVVGKVARYWHSKEALLNQRVGKISPKNTAQLNANFLYYFLLSPTVFKELAINATGSANQANISTEQLRNLSILLPDIDYQIRTGQLLNNIDCLISLKEKQNRTLELTAQALFKHWFVDFEFPNEDGKPYKSSGGQMVDSELGEIPEGWEINRIGDLCSKVTKGTTPTSVGGKFSDIGVNFIKVESLTDEGGFVPSKFAHIDEYSNKLLKRSQLDPGDILISIAGTIGRVALVTEEILPANTNQALAILRVEGKWRAFLKYALTDSTVRNKLLENVVEAVQANLSLGIISNTQMVTPNSKTLLCFDSVAENLLAKINLNNKMITNLSKLRDLLLPKLISGEIRLAA